MNIKDKLQRMQNDFAPEHMVIDDRVRRELLDIWNYLHSIEKPEPILQVKLLHDKARVPTRGSDGAIGWDLYASPDETTISPLLSLGYGQSCKIKTGISIAVPPTHYARIAPRSGLAVNLGIDVMAGVVDSDYRGEIVVILVNVTNGVAIVDLTKPIAQLILERADQGKLMVVDELQETIRGDGGFGSTDNKVVDEKLVTIKVCARCNKQTRFNKVFIETARWGHLCVDCYKLLRD